MTVHYHPAKANLVEDDHRSLFMGSVAHFKEERNEQAKNVHRLGSLGVHLITYYMVM